jgi:hypothetical protein
VDGILAIVHPGRVRLLHANVAWPVPPRSQQARIVLGRTWAWLSRVGGGARLLVMATRVCCARVQLRSGRGFYVSRGQHGLIVVEVAAGTGVIVLPLVLVVPLMVGLAVETGVVVHVMIILDLVGASLLEQVRSVLQLFEVPDGT